ncbi:MAG: hypothetical protein CM1200mP39_12740 [Dehalococcoidia bacterium]|nr:MAG: hypothetical protein CM1200mP39_12740 [Dehalococcoidia bacterium]
MINFICRKSQPSWTFLAPDPASQKTCTIGGNVGENAGGPHCLLGGDNKSCTRSRGCSADGLSHGLEELNVSRPDMT